jgi:dTMP kinase
MFITIEGIDGSGKSTQVAKLQKYLQMTKRPHLITSEPSQNTETEKNIYSILKNDSPTGTTDLLLCMVLRHFHINNVVKPALIQNKIVVCDRYIDSSIAYYGRKITLFDRYIDPPRITDYQKKYNTVLDLHKSITDDLMPDLTFLLDMPAKLSAKRMVDRQNLDKFDSMKIDDMEDIRTVFLYNAKNGIGKGRTHIIDATLGEDDVFDSIVKIAVSKLTLF